MFEVMSIGDIGKTETKEPSSQDAESLHKATKALFTAAAIGNGAAARLALLKGANVEARNLKGQSALMIAVKNESVSVISELLSRGADAHSFCQSGYSPFTLALRSRGPEHTKQLFGNKVELELSNEKKVKIFRSASVCGNKDLLDFVVRQGLQIPANEEPLVFNPETPMVDLMILKTTHQYGCCL